MLRYDPQIHRLCVITDRRLSGGLAHEEIARRALAGGANFIQFREKEMSAAEMCVAAEKVRRITEQHGALLVINDRADVAAAVGADGVHLGRDDLPVAAARRILGPMAVIGASAREAAHAVEAESGGADYLGVGPVFEARATKPDVPAPQGAALVLRIRQVCSLPVIAIGGIGAHNAEEPIRAGASGIAVLSAVAAAGDITAAVTELLEAVRCAHGTGEA